MKERRFWLWMMVLAASAFNATVLIVFLCLATSSEFPPPGIPMLKKSVAARMRQPEFVVLFETKQLARR